MRHTSNPADAAILAELLATHGPDALVRICAEAALADYVGEEDGEDLGPIDHEDLGFWCDGLVDSLHDLD